jgi:HK97 family phage prohead protease
MTTATIEKRGAALELRARGRLIEGHAAVFDSPAPIDGRFTEVVKRGAFAATLASQRDVLALKDHDPAQLLARTKSGTLRLHEDAKGLAFSIDVPATTLGRDLLEMVERGDVGGASFAFIPTDERWSGDIRELRSVRLIEISIVSAWPAYATTSVSARSGCGSGRLTARLGRAYLDTLGRSS